LSVDAASEGGVGGGWVVCGGGVSAILRLETERVHPPQLRNFDRQLSCRRDAGNSEGTRKNFQSGVRARWIKWYRGMGDVQEGDQKKKKGLIGDKRGLITREKNRQLSSKPKQPGGDKVRPVGGGKRRARGRRKRKAMSSQPPCFSRSDSGGDNLKSR